MIIFSIVTDEHEIDTLRGLTSSAGDFSYGYGDESIAEDTTLIGLRNNLHRKDSLYLIARENGAFAAFCALDTEWWEDGYAFLREIFVHPDFQGRGIGAELMRRCEDHARALGLLGIVTETAFENTPMWTLCERCGFVKWHNPEWNEGITYKKLF